MFNTEEEELRYIRWAEAIHDFVITDFPVFVWKTVKERDRYGKIRSRRRKVFSHYQSKGVGLGIDEPTQEELDAVYAKPCRYRRAARASRT